MQLLYSFSVLKGVIHFFRWYPYIHINKKCEKALRVQRRRGHKSANELLRDTSAKTAKCKALCQQADNHNSHSAGVTSIMLTKIIINIRWRGRAMCIIQNSADNLSRYITVSEINYFCDAPGRSARLLFALGALRAARERKKYAAAFGCKIWIRRKYGDLLSLYQCARRQPAQSKKNRRATVGARATRAATRVR